MTDDGTMIVNFASLHSASEAIEVALGKLNGGLDELDRSAQRLVATWTGEAKAAYHTRQVGWRNDAAELSGLLRDIKKELDNSAQHYLETEKKNTNLFPASG